MPLLVNFLYPTAAPCVAYLFVGFGPFLAQWQQFLDHIVDMDLLEAATCKRIIDGKQLSKELNAKPGIWMARALDLVMAWQFRNPTVTDPRGAIEEVKARAAELKIPIQ
jgi:tRNA nucleotidyltransferase (CCA-adding enzyme)